MSLRKIIHVDCDCFYAAIEMRDDPRLAGRPMAVGGSPERRGVIATCNYEARAYGVRSAMSSRHALKLCPDLLIVKPRFEAYREASREIHAIFRDYTELIEPLSLDEAYLDVSDSQWYSGSATRIAEDIRRRVARTLHITVSAGVAPNKFLAKIASDWRKPNGLFVITPGEVEAFVAALPVARLHGVGKVTADKLARLGIETCLICGNGHAWHWCVSLAALASVCGGWRGVLMSAPYTMTAAGSQSALKTPTTLTCRTWPVAWRGCLSCWKALTNVSPVWTAVIGRTSRSSRSSSTTSARPPWSRQGLGGTLKVIGNCWGRRLPVVANRCACWG